MDQFETAIINKFIKPGEAPAQIRFFELVTELVLESQSNKEMSFAFKYSPPPPIQRILFALMEGSSTYKQLVGITERERETYTVIFGDFKVVIVRKSYVAKNLS